MAFLSTKLPFDLMITKWAATLNPFLGNPLNDVSILQNVNLINGTTVINHLLGRTQQGWFLVDVQGPATIYRATPFNNLTLSLTSSAATTVSIGVF
jgi:hypothetical protein